MWVNLSHLNFFGDFISFDYFKVGRFNFRSPLDCELNSLEIFFSQKSFFFFKMLIITAFTEKHFDLKYFNCFISYYFNYFIFLQTLINQTNSHLNEFHQFHFIFIDFLVDFYLPMGFHRYWNLEKESYYFKHFKSEDSNFTFNSNFIINNSLLYFPGYDSLSLEKETLPCCHLVSEQSGVQVTCLMNGKCSIMISILKQGVSPSVSSKFQG